LYIQFYKFSENKSIKSSKRIILSFEPTYTHM